jgi:aldehyde dehydrogenase (NAD+)
MTMSDTETHLKQHYIGGRWVDSKGGKLHDVINPATEETASTVVLGTAADVDDAVAAAKEAFKTFSQTTREERLDLLNRIVEEYKKRGADLAKSMASEMGAPVSFASTAQVGAGIGGFLGTIAALKDFSFTEKYAAGVIAYEPIGVVGMITPWNWPLNQIALKVAPALAAGNTMVLKPSEECPGNAVIFAEILEAAGVPAGVFNLVQGDGPTVGNAISAHPGIEMVSFTGSTRAGILVAKAAADTVKRVHQELGGKSPNILLDDADFDSAVPRSVRSCFGNSGQSCNAPTRLLVPRARHDEVIALARKAAEAVHVGPPRAAGTTMGPVVSAVQFERIQKLIGIAIAEGATLVTGGPGRPDGLERGYYVRPTIFADVNNEMTIAREEVFGPVLAIIPYDSEEEAIAIANDTPYGLSSYITSGDRERARRIARRMRAGMVHLNGAPLDSAVPFGGYKQSGNGRECGVFGFEDFLEVKAVFGHGREGVAA